MHMHPHTQIPLESVEQGVTNVFPAILIHVMRLHLENACVQVLALPFLIVRLLVSCPRSFLLPPSHLSGPSVTSVPDLSATRWSVDHVAHISHGVLYISPSVTCLTQQGGCCGLIGILSRAMPNFLQPLVHMGLSPPPSLSLPPSFLPRETESGRASERESACEKEQGIERQREQATAARERERSFIDNQEVTEGR
jgi:hypothetical protein